ncbi:MAG: protein kinase [Acidobacteriia bacterium]|nr:protein kinase [Terriglobia bacterium]
MPRCPACSADVPERNHFCGVCGAGIGSNSQAPTVAMARERTPTPSSSSIDEGRFPVGAILAERYRILGLVGQGGMGEVYRANDLKLNQPVALKFLPAATTRNLLDRFHAEVRIARQVSHPNVCRVYDIGEVDGSTFLSMEYVDGEDLRSLLRRIGRLPGDKALEIARRLCAGLAAAHDKGVLHRDLKPANIMLDGRGQVLITDFGLAGLADQIEQVREGTPAYMAPEQAVGREVTVRSDIYALGLVLHEMFTGKRRDDTATTPTSLVKDMDPAVERVILKCLEPDPQNRPPSALAVARALPGGDPLAAALAAGDTPSPEMVAAAGDTEGISVRTAGICLAWILVGLVAAVMLGAKTNVLQKTPFPDSPEILAQKAREMIQSFGYAAPPADHHYEFSYNAAYQTYVEKQGNPAAYRDQLAKGQPPLIYFWYRQSPQPMVPSGPAGAVSLDDPPPIISGMIGLNLDPQGRLLQLDAVPPQVDEIAPLPSSFDWRVLFTAAGLDMSRFTVAEPRWISLAPFDARAAWTGSYPSSPEIPMRIEAGSWRGKPVFFRIIGPWSKPGRMQQAANLPAAVAVVGLVGITLGVFLAWRNFRAKKGDVRGANRVAVFVFAGAWLDVLLHGHHVATVDELALWILGALISMLPALIVWTFYLAFEPYVRRRWPQSMITWSRVLSGGFRDPLVGGHLVFGVALGIGLVLEYSAYRMALEHYGMFPTTIQLPSTLDARRLTGTLANVLVGTFLAGMAYTFILMLLRVLLRRQWIAAASLVLLWGGLLGFGSAHPVIAVVHNMLQMAVFVTILLRLGGLFTTIVCGFVGETLTSLPLTTDFSNWYASATIFAVVVVLALTAYAFHTAVAGRPLFRAGFLDAD